MRSLYIYIYKNIDRIAFSIDIFTILFNFGTILCRRKKVKSKEKVKSRRKPYRDSYWRTHIRESACAAIGSIALVPHNLAAVEVTQITITCSYQVLSQSYAPFFPTRTSIPMCILIMHVIYDYELVPYVVDWRGLFYYFKYNPITYRLSPSRCFQVSHRDAWGCGYVDTRVQEPYSHTQT